MQDYARSRGMDRLRRPKRFILDRSGFHRGAMPSGAEVSTQKHIEIVFEGTDSSCYPQLSLGAEGIVPSMSRSPN